MFRRLIQNFLDVCNTVHFAHSQNIVHRDLKPENIMIGKFGETYVVDWGLAKMIASNTSESKTNPQSNENTEFTFLWESMAEGCSVDGETVGSPGFMSPEQKNGEHFLVGPQSDVFSLGATLLSVISVPNRDPGRLEKKQIGQSRISQTPINLQQSDVR